MTLCGIQTKTVTGPMAFGPFGLWKVPFSKKKRINYMYMYMFWCSQNDSESVVEY